jgi:hypothetical protein
MSKEKKLRAYRQGIRTERDRVVRIIRTLKWLKHDEREALIDAITWLGRSE